MDSSDSKKTDISYDGISHGSAALFIFITVLFLLALVSFSPADIASFSTDHAQLHFPANLLGFLGANIMWGMLLTIGLGTHMILALLVIGAIRRTFCLKLLRKTSWDYAAAVLLAAFAASMLASTWDRSLFSIAKHYNLSTMAGGVLGDIVCGASGILRYVLNTVGITLLSMLFFAASAWIIIYYDWALVIKAVRKKQLERKAKQPRKDEHVSVRQEKDMPAPLRQQELPLDIPPAQPEPPAPPRTQHAEQRRTDTADANGAYKIPPTSLLAMPTSDAQTAASAQEIQTNQEHLQHTLNAFNIDGTVVNSVPGPQVTLFKIQLANGVRVESIKSIENNIKMELRASSIRILAPIPGESLVGVEVPNKVLKSVPVRAMLEDPQWTNSADSLPILLGKNISGKTVCIDLARAPHLLIAGATGTGKSVCMNLIIMSLLYKHSPDTLRLIMVDPKKVEFSIYQNLPHLLVPVITENSKVALALKWACNEMDRRYRILQKVGCRDLKSFNSRRMSDNEPLDDEGNPIPRTLPFIVIVIDELADIMLTSKNEVENSLARIAALARATGIHAILATQRPDVHVITGTIKSNFPVRIAFRVASHTDSQTIIGTKGAEALLGCGDMIYKPAGVTMERIQGGMASDDERNKVVEFITSQCPPPVFDESILVGDHDDTAEMPMGGTDGDFVADTAKDLFEQAIDIVFRDRKTSISYIQRRLNIGYNKAATLVERLEDEGIIGPKNGTASAEILMTDDEYYARRGGNALQTVNFDAPQDNEHLNP